MGAKTVSIVIPTYNEEENVRPVVDAVRGEISNELPEYDYEIIVIDNNSNDHTRNIIRELCAEDRHVKAIFNEKNVGLDNSEYYGLLQATGDCAILFCADFQDPPEMIHKMVREWEKGYKVIVAVKTQSKENPVMRFFRTRYYRLIRKMSDTQIIEHFTGFGCYDRSFIETLRELNDPIPFLRGVVAEFASNRLDMPYVQQKRKAGRSHIRFLALYDIAMRSFTSYTKIGLRMASFLGYAVAALSFLIALVYFIVKLFHWNDFGFGVPVILVGMFFIGGVQLIFMGLMGEYILAINQRSMKRPLVVERERINFDCNQEQ